MKVFRSIVLLAAMLLCAPTQTASAQTHYSSNVAIGVKGGVDVSRVFFNPTVYQKLPIGGVAGVRFRYVEEAHFGLIAELNFAQKGWENDFKETDYRYRRTLNYIELPVLAHIYFGRRGRFFANVGPQVSYMLGESTSTNFDVSNIANLPDFPYPKRVNDNLWLPVKNKVDFGISAGLGGEFSINRKNSVDIEARFYYGIGNIFSSKHQDPFRASNAMSVAVTAGYWFRIK